MLSRTKQILQIFVLVLSTIGTALAEDCGDIDDANGYQEHGPPEFVNLGPAGTMIKIPDGDFCMGDIAGNGEPDEKPIHVVHVESFWLGRYEVTRQQFSIFVDATGYLTDAERENGAQPGCLAVDASEWSFRYRPAYSWQNPGFEQTDKHPVVCISYDDTVAFITWLNQQTGLIFRLPTEAEWEYVARASTRTTYPWGNSIIDSCEYANVADRNVWPGYPKSPFGRIDCNDGYAFTAIVGRYNANLFGIFDISGNVWEWTSDCWSKTYSFENVSEICGQRVFRGSSWMNSKKSLRSANRSKNGPSDRLNTVGYRLALDEVESTVDIDAAID